MNRLPDPPIAPKLGNYPVKETEAKLHKAFKVRNDALEGRKQLLGNEVTVADLNLAHLFSCGRRVNFDYSAHPNIDRWLDDCLSRPAYLRVKAKRGEVPAEYKKVGNMNEHLAPFSLPIAIHDHTPSHTNPCKGGAGRG